jgi:hypothetical protein
VLTSTWFVGVLVAAATWNVAIGTPYVGLDNSWVAGLYMAAHDGLHFGSEVIWTYGPLGFLAQASVIYRGLGVIAFLYQSALHIALCVSLIWAIRRLLGLPLAAVLAYVIVAITSRLELTLALTALWCLAALSPSPPSHARHLVAIGGGALGAIGCLVKLSVGPAILLMSAATLVALPTRSRDLLRFAITAVATFAVAWFATGQSVGNLPDYVSSSRQVVSGYSEAMGADLQPNWYIFAAIEVIAMLVVWSVVSAASGWRRAAAGVVMAIAAFAAFKEGVVRFDDGHIPIFFATATVLTAAIPWRRGLFPAALVTLLLAAGLTVHITGASADGILNPVPRFRDMGSALRLAASPGRMDAAAEGARSNLRSVYRLDPKTLALLRRHPLDVRPWENLVAWAYGLDWRPEPVFQGYNAYTSALDRDNARFLASAPAAQRILRSVPTALGEPVGNVDGRNTSWDPPLATVAMLCDYAPLRTTSSWQVVGKVPGRCGAMRPLGSVETTYGQTVNVPKAPPGAVVIAKVHGAGVSGLESLQAFFFRADNRYATVNRPKNIYRLVPGTAADGLLMSVPKPADFPGQNFALSPGARRLTLSGKSGDLRIDFYALPIRNLPRSAR